MKIYPWNCPHCSSKCARCEGETGWYHSADGVRVCVDCLRRSCKVCHVVMAQHQRCTGPCE